MHDKWGPLCLQVARTALTAAILLLLSACSEGSHPAPLKIGANPWPGYEPLFIAEQQGLFPPRSVHLVETPVSLGISQALRGGTIQGGAVTLSRVIKWPDPESRPVIVLVFDYSNGLDRIAARPGIKSIKDLKGRRVAAELGSVAGYILVRALELSGMTLQDVTIVNIENSEIAEMYLDGQVDAAAGFGDPIDRIEEAGAKLLFTSSDIPREILDVMSIRGEFLERNPAFVEDAILGWMRAMHLLETLPEGQPYPEGAMRAGEMQDAMQHIIFASAEENYALMSDGAEALNALIDSRFASALARGVVQPGVDRPRVEPGPFLRAYERFKREQDQ